MAKRRLPNVIHAVEEFPTSPHRSQWDVYSTYRNGKKIGEVPERIPIYPSMSKAIAEAQKRKKRYGGTIFLSRYKRRR